MPYHHRVTRCLLVAVAAALFLAASQPKDAPPTRYPGLEQITAADLRSYLTFIASDELEGRDTPSRGLDTAALYIASHLSRWGLKPAGDEGTYFQRIALVEQRVDRDKSRVRLGDHTFVHGDDFIAGSTPGRASGQLVYVGHGYMIKERKLDPYASLDIKGKIIIAHDSMPSGVGRGDLRGKQGVDWDDPAGAAQRHGAVGVIYLPSHRTLASWRREAAEPTYHVEKLPDDDAEAVPSITASPRLVDALFDGEDTTAADVLAGAISREPEKPFTLDAHKTLSIVVALSRRPARTQNVVAIVEGSDPVLKQEYVALGAHYDHVGVGVGSGDVIYNGADDDGSGTVALLSMARALATASPRPKRSVLFTWHAGEEHGLWGSEYFTRFPTVPLDRIVAQLNVDMIGRSRKPGDDHPANRNLTGPDSTYVIGSTLMSSELERLSREVNAGLFNLSFDYKYDERGDRERLFYRSDHYNYAKQNIPVIFYFSGLHEDYHDVGDSADKIDYTKMEKIARTIYATARTIADLPHRPAVDKRLPSEDSR